MLILNTSDGYEALYVNGELIDEGNPLGEGDSDLYLVRKCEEFKVKSKDIIMHSLTDIDDNHIMDVGGFPQKLSYLTGDYTK
jgi:hypothetical protein